MFRSRRRINKPAAIMAVPSVFFLLLSIFGFSTSAQAEPIPGLAVTIYNNYGYNASPPLPAESGRPIQCTLTYPNIDQDFGDSICGLSDDFIVEYEGYITSPTTQTITFHPQADDGTKLYIDNVLIDNNWVDKGGGGNLSSPVLFTAGVPKPITLWFYENGGGNWVELYWNLNGNYEIVPVEAFTQNDETSYTIAPYLNPVTNLTAVANTDGSVDLDWDAPTSSNTAIYAYSVSFYDLDEIDGTTSGGWGVWTNQGTNYSLSTGMFSGGNPVTTGYGPVRFGIKAGNQSCFSNAGVGPCVYGPEVTADATVLEPTPITTTTSSTTTTSTTVPTTTTSVYSPTTTVPVPTTFPVPETTVPEPEPTPTTLPEDEEETESTTTPTIPQEFDEEEEQDQPTDTNPPQETEEIEDLPSKNITPIESNEINEGTEQEDSESDFESIFDDLTEEETISLIVDVFSGDLDSEELKSALEAILGGEVTDDVLVATFTAIFAQELDAESLEVILDILESDSISSEQVALVVTLIIEQDGGISKEQATALATSAAVLESISGEQASKVFSAIVASEVTQEEGLKIVAALTSASEEVRESFEEEINVFSGVFDTYVPLDSTIDVGTRRSVIAVNLVTSTVALAGAAGGLPTPSSSTSRQEMAARKPEEEEEEGGAIEGEGPDWIKRISIYKYENGERVMDWKNFTKKFVYGVMASGFTIAGAVVMYFTLSGFTQQVALWGTSIAFACSMFLHMKEPDGE